MLSEVEILQLVDLSEENNVFLKQIINDMFFCLINDFDDLDNFWVD